MSTAPSSQVPSDYGPSKPEASAYPQNHQHSHQLPNKFQFGLFDCFSPFSTCCLTCWCPCVTYGRIKERERGERDPSGVNGQVCLSLSFPHLLRCAI
jgi:hypothetical protein